MMLNKILGRFWPLFGISLVCMALLPAVGGQKSGSDIARALAERQIKGYEENNFGGLPICMAKTHLSISHDPKLKNAPSGFTLPVREVRASVGAGFIYPLIGQMRTMPGLPSKPAYMNVDIDENGKVVGLF